MPIHGSVEEAGLPDVLQLLALGRKTGCLALADGDNHGEIYLDMGRISFASVANRDRLGEMLVKSGRITRDQLEAATEEQARNSKRKIGRILLDSGHVDRTELERFVRRQVQEAVYTLFTWKQGTFTFSSDQQPARGALLVSLDADSLLLEGARRVDEWSLIQKKIPSFDLVFQRTKTPRPGGVSEELTDEQRRVMPLLDGSNDVNAIAEQTGMDEFDAGKALYGLIVAGFARRVERRAQFRHLEYRELLAYVVREAEFADAERRKLAARHIVDCPACSERLRTIHVRRTEGQPAVTEEMIRAADPAPDAKTIETPAPVAPPEARTIPTPIPAPRVPASPPAAKTRVVAAPPPPQPPAVTRVVAMPPAPTVAETPQPAAESPAPPARPATPASRPERRERRTADRRAGRDRRQLDRRNLDRRGGADRRQVVIAEWALTNTERRRGERRALDRRVVRRAAPVTVVEASIETAETVASPRPAPRATQPRYAPPESEATPPAAAPAPPAPAAPPGPPRLSKDIVWLMSPEQATQELRASRTARRATDVPAPAPGRRATDNPAAEVERGRRAGERRPDTVGSNAPVVPAFIAPSSQRAEAVPMPPPQARRTPGSIQITLPIRNIKIAAGVGGVLLFGYMLGSLNRGGGPAGPTDAPREVAAAPAAADPAGNGRGVRVAPEPAPPPAPRPPSLETRAASTTGTLLAAPPPRSAPEPRNTPEQQPERTVSAAPPAAPPSPAATAPAQQEVAPQPAPAPAPAPTPAPPPAAAPVSAAAPDPDLASGGWIAIDRGEAATLLGALPGIQGLPVETVARSTSGSRPRVRLSQLAPSGERIVLTITRASAAATGAGSAVITALRVMPPSEAYPMSTGTVSMGNLLITARSSLAADALRSQLERLGHLQ